MRYLAAVIFLSTLGTAPGSAFPVAGAHGVLAPQSDRIVQIATKRKAAAASHHARGKSSGKSSGGVHPLVGSGDY
jgi:hypothetical protein